MHNWTGSVLCVAGTQCASAYIHMNDQDVQYILLHSMFNSFFVFVYIFCFFVLGRRGVMYFDPCNPRNEPATVVLCRLGKKSLSGVLKIIQKDEISQRRVLASNLPQDETGGYNQSGIIDRRSLGGRRSSKVYWQMLVMVAMIVTTGMMVMIIDDGDNEDDGDDYW